MAITNNDLKALYESQKTVFYLFGSSLIVLIAACKNCDTKTSFYGYTYKVSCTQEAGWAVACSVVSVAFTLVPPLTALFNSALAEKLSVGLSTFLAIWWFPGAFVLTFQGPFTTVGNGYFGSWACFLFAIQWFGSSAVPAIKAWRESHLSAAPPAATAAAATAEPVPNAAYSEAPAEGPEKV